MDVQVVVIIAVDDMVGSYGWRSWCTFYCDDSSSYSFGFVVLVLIFGFWVLQIQAIDDPVRPSTKDPYEDQCSSALPTPECQDRIRTNGHGYGQDLYYHQGQ